MIEVEQLPVERLGEWLDVRNRLHADDALPLETVVHRRGRELAHVDLLATVCGAPAGVGTYGRLRDSPGSRVGRISLHVLPQHRCRGVGTALHRAASAVGREHGDEELEAQVVAPGLAAERYVAARGYREVLRMVESRLDLEASDAVSRARLGVELRSAADDPAVLEGAYLVALESEPDIPEARAWVRPASFEEWRAREIDDATLVPEATLVAFVDGKPAAYGLVQLERPRVGAHLATGVARACRGRGLATALKRAQIDGARRIGLRRLVAWNAQENAPIRRVNAKLGYRVTADVVTYRGPLL